MLRLVIMGKGCSDDGTISTWRREHPGYEKSDLLDVESLPSSASLFDDVPAVEITVESAPAAQVRALNKEAGDEVDVLVITATQTTAKFDRDGIEVTDLSLPKSSSALSSLISSREGVSKKVASRCISATESGASAMIMARQIALLDEHDARAESLAWDPWRQNPPWAITDAITSGNARAAYSSVMDMTATGVKPQALTFQLMGYFRKIVVCTSDPGGVMGDGNAGVFVNKRRGLRDVDLLVKDLDDVPQRVLSSPHPRHALAASASIMSTRFKGARR